MARGPSERQGNSGSHPACRRCVPGCGDSESKAYALERACAWRVATGCLLQSPDYPTHVCVLPQAPWGGNKNSGFGRELGEWGLENFLSVKQVTTYVSPDPWGWYSPPSKL